MAAPRAGQCPSEAVVADIEPWQLQQHDKDIGILPVLVRVPKRLGIGWNLDQDFFEGLVVCNTSTCSICDGNNGRCSSSCHNSITTDTTTQQGCELCSLCKHQSLCSDSMHPPSPFAFPKITTTTAQNVFAPINCKFFAHLLGKHWNTAHCRAHGTVPCAYLLANTCNAMCLHDAKVGMMAILIHL